MAVRYNLLRHGETPGVLRGVLPLVLLQGVAVAREVCHRPGRKWDVQFVDGLGVGAGEGGSGPPVEPAVVGQDGEGGGARGLVN